MVFSRYGKVPVYNFSVCSKQGIGPDIYLSANKGTG